MIGVQKIKKSGTVYYRVVTEHGTKSWSAKKFGAKEARALAHAYVNDNGAALTKKPKVKLPTLERAIFDYEAHKDGKIERSTFRQLVQVNRRWLKTSIAAMHIDEISPRHVGAAVTELKQLGFSEDAISRSIVRLKAAAKQVEIDYQSKDFNFRNMIDSYVNELSLDEKDRKQNIERPIPSADDIQKLIAGTQGNLHIFICIAAMTGLRPSEIRGLQWQAIDWDNNSISVNTKADEQNKLSARLKNKNAYRSVPLVPQLKKILQPLAKVNGLVLATKYGNPLPHNQIAEALSKVKAKYNIDGWQGLHGFRHYYASILIKNMVQLGLDFKQVPTILGHRDFGFTSSVYAHVLSSDQEHKQLCQKLDVSLPLI